MPGFAGKLKKSFLNAAHGIAFLFKSQPNARIELTITVLVLLSGIFFKISAAEWCIILLCIALVIGFEGINTALEVLADKLHPGVNKEIGLAKDVAAGAVLITALVAAIVGFIIFAPRLLELWINS